MYGTSASIFALLTLWAESDALSIREALLLQGSWRIVSCRLAGKEHYEMNDPNLLLIQADWIDLKVLPFQGTFTIDATKSSKRMHIKVAHFGRHQGPPSH